ncbi:hypothetical protein PTSG_11623 [Salpingoeca rosetta]|uniref:Uncharacterized protein n=1 Tax=Salpingoeca rosetta (strain ATCC 50818 / BSB-021) TaxID=946362 RepID=F2TX17_SALR5|nr:uncharacterized protein PTSG_11623 [Salpingoeca rosetta]EGD75926.1 hypothetical protein PTSG_11623 [Salpingoeca rosetta]|eukprot:XP_004998102.1 hypothetical protein PTSG_11623 [Salpingoeca rosetta]
MTLACMCPWRRRACLATCCHHLQSYSPGDRGRTDWSDNPRNPHAPIPTSTACTCTRASSATASDACHDAELVNDTGHHKHIDAAATTNDWSGMADVNGSIVCSNGNNGSNNGNSCDGS